MRGRLRRTDSLQLKVGLVQVHFQGIHCTFIEMMIPVFEEVELKVVVVSNLLTRLPSLIISILNIVTCSPTNTLTTMAKEERKTVPWAWLPTTPPTNLEEALSLLIRKGFVRNDDIDGETKTELKTLPHYAQMQALIRFQEALIHQKVKSKR